MAGNAIGTGASAMDGRVLDTAEGEASLRGASGELAKDTGRDRSSMVISVVILLSFTESNRVDAQSPLGDDNGLASKLALKASRCDVLESEKVWLIEKSGVGEERVLAWAVEKRGFIKSTSPGSPAVWSPSRGASKSLEISMSEFLLKGTMSKFVATHRRTD